MIRSNPHRKESANYIHIIGMGVILLVIFIGTYLLKLDLPVKEPYEFGQLITDSGYYSDSETPNWHRIDAGPFFIEAPRSYQLYRLMGFDSSLGGITNQTDTIQFEFGWYSNSLIGYSKENYIINQEMINGYSYRIVQKKGGEGYTAAYTEKPRSSNELWIGCVDCQNQSEVIRMFKTIRLK